MDNRYFDANNCQIMLQLHDKNVLDKDELAKKLNMSFKTGKMDKTYWARGDVLVKIQFFMQLYDRELISKDILLEQVFAEEEKTV